VNASTVRIRFDQTMRAATPSSQYFSIRGALHLELDGKTVPGLHDASFNDWLGLLQDVMQHFQLGGLEYVDDITEPYRLVFRRNGEIALLTLLDAASTSAFSFRWMDLEPALQAFGAALLEALQQRAPEAFKHWWAAFMP
jgi:hypothetical protein